MNQKNYVVEVLSKKGEQSAFIVRELSQQPNQPAVCVAVVHTADELGEVFGRLVSDD